MCQFVLFGVSIPYWSWQRMAASMNLLLQNDHLPIAEFLFFFY
jgi:hypothetical protein